jgi:hypothetical protein
MRHPAASPNTQDALQTGYRIAGFRPAPDGPKDCASGIIDSSDIAKDEIVAA